MTEHSEPLGAQAPSDPPVMADPPAYRLFTPDQVGGASFCGGALAGAILLLLNSGQLKDGKGKTSLAVGLLLTALMVFIAFHLPERFPSAVLAAVALVVMRAYAQQVQGQAVAEHVSQGGRKGSLGRAFLVVLLSAGLIVGSVFGIVYATLPPSYKLGKDEVIYRSGVQQSEARSLAESLKRLEFFQDKGISVFLSKPDGRYHVGVVLQEGAWNSAETCDAFRPLGPELAQSTFHSTPVVIELVNDQGEVKKSL